jgi:hypothetical protein
MTAGPRENFDQPSAARLYDLYLGGTHNYPVDRNFAAEVLETVPFMPEIAVQNRQFLRRAAQYMAEHGIQQFIDIGSGVPTVDNVHQVVHRIDPLSRVVYVDNDNEAIVTSQQMLEAEPRATAIFGDLRDPEAIFADPEVRHLIDFSQPIGLLTVAVLHFVGPQDNPRALMRRYRDDLPPGSYLGISHATVDEVTPEVRGQLRELEAKYGSTADPVTIRTKAEFTEFFEGWNLVDPGVVHAADWRPTEQVGTDSPARPSLWAAVGRKPLLQVA